MKTQLTIENPGNIEMTLKVTMTLNDWKQFRQQLGEQWPSSRFTYAITEMCMQAETRFQPKTEPEAG